MSHEVETMFSVKHPTWHGLGDIRQDYPDSATALAASGLMWPVETRDIYFRDMDGAFRCVPDRKAVVRVIPKGVIEKGIRIIDPRAELKDDVLSLVSHQYEVLQNDVAFSVFDPLVKSGELVYETAGSLQEGRKIWILARYTGETMKIMGTDEIVPYVLLLNGHDGCTSITVKPTKIRVVCRNTLQASLAEGGTISFQHKGDMEGNIKKAIEMIGNLRERLVQDATIFEDMAETRISHDDMEEITFNVMYPADDVPTEQELAQNVIENTGGHMTARRKTRMYAACNKVFSLIRDGQGATKDTGGTVWGFYNALVEFAEYYLGRKNVDIGNYQLFGAAAKFKERALAQCSEYCITRTPPQEIPVGV